MSRLLVSIRSIVEVEPALAGGADLLDLKEPGHGPLGEMAPELRTLLADAVAGRRPLSAALGELGASTVLPADAGRFTYLKWGLAGWRDRDWAGALRRLVVALGRLSPQPPASVLLPPHPPAPSPTAGRGGARRSGSPLPAVGEGLGVRGGPAGGPGQRPRVVAVAYADARRAGAPLPEAVAEFAAELGGSATAFLLDTWGKDGSTLLDWLDLATLDRLIQCCDAAGVPVALAGSLGAEEIVRLRSLEPDWFAVRRAACAGGRGGQVEAERVRALVALLS